VDGFWCCVLSLLGLFGWLDVGAGIRCTYNLYAISLMPFILSYACNSSSNCFAACRTIVSVPTWPMSWSPRK
jgi:hypothetical protein